MLLFCGQLNKFEHVTEGIAKEHVAVAKRWYRRDLRNNWNTGRLSLGYGGGNIFHNHGNVPPPFRGQMRGDVVIFRLGSRGTGHPKKLNH